MKVLIVTRSFVREVSALVRHAARAAWPVEFAVVLPSGENPFQKGIETHPTPSQEGIRTYAEPLPAKVSTRKLYFPQRMRAACYAPVLFQDIRRFQPDILHVFEEFSGGIAFQAVFFRNLLRQRSKIMVYSAENLRRNMRAVFRLTGKYVAAYSDLAFVCSRGVQEVLAAEGYAKPIGVFPLGIDTDKFAKFPVDELKAELQLDGKFVLGYVGRLLDIKGVHLLIEMMRALPEPVHLLLVGSGPEEQHLRTMALKYRLAARIHFMGNVLYDQLPQYLNCMDVGIAPSKTTRYWKEQFGRAIVELMSCEVPVIGSDSGSIPEVLGEAGHIFPENNLAELVTRLKILLASSEQRAELGKIGRTRAITHYSLDIMCKRFLAMYHALLNHR